MANTKEKWQEIANRGLQDRFDPQTRAKFDEAVRRGLINLPEQQQTASKTAIVEGDFIPTEEALEAARIESESRPKPSLVDKVLGAGEAALTTVTGATTGAVGFGVGSLTGAVGELTGRLEKDKGLTEAQELGSKFTYEPRTEYGQRMVRDIAEVASVLPPVLGTTPVVGVKGLTAPSRAKLSSMKSPLAKRISEESAGGLKKSFERKLKDRKFDKNTQRFVNDAIKQGFDEGMVKVIINSTPIDRRRMLQMVENLEKGKVDELFRAKNRPADVAGTSLLRKIEFIKKNNSDAGKQLGRVAESLKGKEVDVSAPVSKFIDDLRSLGVVLDEKGKPLFEGSQIEGVAPAESLINKIALRLKRNPAPDALDAHNIKKFIDENVNFGKSAEGLGGKTERITKSLRKGINDSISAKYDKYREANSRFADTIQALNEVQDASGRKLDFFNVNADKAVGVALRTLLSNNKGRARMMNAIDNVESTAKKYGGSFDDDILTQMLFADELDAVFGGAARTSLRGEIKKAAVDTAVDLSQMTVPGAIAVGIKEGAKRARGVNEKNQLKAIKKLLRSKNE